MRVQREIVSNDYTGIIDQTNLKAFLRFDGTDQDNVLTSLTAQGIKYVEDYCNRTLGDAVIRVQFIDADLSCKLRLPFGPVRGVTSVKSIAQDGTPTTLTEGDDYNVIGLTTKYIILINRTYTTSSYYQTIEVEYTAGNATPSTTDEALRGAIYKVIADYFENRENSITMSIMRLPQDVTLTLNSYRLK